MFHIECEGNEMLYLTSHDSLAVFCGARYHVSIILFEFQDYPFMGSTQLVYCELFDKQL